MKTLVKTILTRIALYEMMEAEEILYQLRLKKNITCGMKKLGFMWEQLAEKCI